MNVINLYLKGLENMVAYFRRISNKNKSVLFNRVPIIKHIKNRIGQNIIWALCVVIEPFVSFIIESVLFIPYIFKSIFTRKKPLSDKLYIDNCPLLRKRTISAAVYDESKDWVYSLGVPDNDKDCTKTIHTIFEYLNCIDVLLAYLYAVVATFASLKITKFKYVMRNYSAFEYCLTYRYLRKIPQSTTICFCNQIDKWALLFDDAPLNKILFQHGIESPTANWPNKLKSIDTVYVLSMEESKLLFRAAFSRKPSLIRVMSSTISLTPVNKNQYSILVVGFPGYSMFDKESAIVETFCNKPFFVYLKPHPGKEDMTRYENLAIAHPESCKLVMGQMFPDVDIVVSYRSTLAVEYQAYNKKVLLYNDYSMEDIIDYIRQDSKSKQ